MSYDKAITRTDLTNILNEVLPNTSVDYIVEQGTSGVWTYRKWESGVAECWSNAATTLTVNTSWGSIYVSSKTSRNFPSGLFNALPCVTAFATGNASVFTICGSGTTKDIFYYFLASAASLASQSYNLNVYAKGTWK